MQRSKPVIEDTPLGQTRDLCQDYPINAATQKNHEAIVESQLLQELLFKLNINLKPASGKYMKCAPVTVKIIIKIKQILLYPTVISFPCLIFLVFQFE